MYTDMYNTYDRENIPYHQKYSFYLRNKAYLELKQIPSISWFQGNTAEITFHITWEDIMEDIDLFNSLIILKFYNFRKEPMDLFFEFPPENDVTEERQIILNLSKEISDKYFSQGIYYAEMVISQGEKILTILSKDKCMIEVK